jgi:ParB family chromosome partitioning protein
MVDIVEVSPFRCRVWHLHERLEEYVSEQTCEAEIRSFEERGQLVPAIGRRLVGDHDHDIEIICGLRRLFVARYLNKPLTVDLRQISDAEGFLAMDVENRQRKEVSPYERGLCYARWLRSGQFQSQEDLARALKISASQVSKLLKLARLPSVIVNAFGNAAEIREGWGGEVFDALDDARKRPALIRTARELSAMNPRPAAEKVYRHLLMASTSGRKPRMGDHDQVVKGEDGLALFRVRRQINSVALILPLEKISARSLQEIQDAVAGILEGSPAVDRTSEGHTKHRRQSPMSIMQITAVPQA